MVEIRAHNDEPLRALILTDGKMGDLAQCRGIADALPAHKTEIAISPDTIARLIGTTAWDAGFRRDVAALPAPPDLVIASGRRTWPYLRAIPGLLPAKPLTIFLKDPRKGPGAADLIWVPAHDRLRGDTVIVTDTSPHGHTPARQEEAARALQNRLRPQELPRPWLGVFLGGRTPKVRYDEPTVARLVRDLSAVAEAAGSVLVTPSRRTPDSLIAALKTVHPRLWVWDGTGDNPYTGMLGACDALFVTGDSHNMVSEALSTGRQVSAFRPDGLPPKFHRFLDAMEAKGVVRPPAPADFHHRQVPIDATPEIAATIRAKLKETQR